MNDQPDLFDVGDRDPHQLRGRDHKTTCTPFPVGSGPRGERCGTCRHLHRNRTGSGKHYLKCGLMLREWTGGAGTDIKARWTACRSWRPLKLSAFSDGALIGSVTPPDTTIDDPDLLRATSDYWEERGDDDRAELCRALADTEILTVVRTAPGSPDTPEQSGTGQDPVVEVPL